MKKHIANAKRYVMIKKNRASKDILECSILQLIVNEEEFLVINEEFFLGIEDCRPLNSIQVLGYFDSENTEIALLFNLFAIKNEALFAVENLKDINFDEPLVLEIIPIHSLNFRRTITSKDYIYLFKEKCLYKIKFSNFVPYFDSKTGCGEVTNRQIALVNPNTLQKQITQLKKTIKSRKMLFEKLSIMVNSKLN